MSDFAVIPDTAIWHVEAADNPSVALCGEPALPGDTHVPAEEVPDESCCPECLRIEAQA